MSDDPALEPPEFMLMRRDSQSVCNVFQKRFETGGRLELEGRYAVLVADWFLDFKQRVQGTRAFDSRLGALWFVGIKDRNRRVGESNETLKDIAHVLENQLEQESLTSWGLHEMRLNGYRSGHLSRYLPD